MLLNAWIKSDWECISTNSNKKKTSKKLAKNKTCKNKHVKGPITRLSSLETCTNSNKNDHTSQHTIYTIHTWYALHITAEMHFIYTHIFLPPMILLQLGNSTSNQHNIWNLGNKGRWTLVKWWVAVSLVLEHLNHFIWKWLYLNDLFGQPS